MAGLKDPPYMPPTEAVGRVLWTRREAGLKDPPYVRATNGSAVTTAL